MMKELVKLWKTGVLQKNLWRTNCCMKRSEPLRCCLLPISTSYTSPFMLSMSQSSQIHIRAQSEERNGGVTTSRIRPCSTAIPYSAATKSFPLSVTLSSINNQGEGVVLWRRGFVINQWDADARHKRKGMSMMMSVQWFWPRAAV